MPAPPECVVLLLLLLLLILFLILIFILILLLFWACPTNGSRLDPRFLPHLIHRPNDLVHTLLEQVADEQVRKVALELRVAADEAAEAEAVVVFAHQPPHALHAARERLTPLAELGFRQIVLLEPFHDGVGRHGTG